MRKNEYEIIISQEAESELILSFQFYEDKRQGLGKKFVVEVDFILIRILENYEQFPKVRNKNIRKAVLSTFPFSIYFATNDNIISILAIFHGSRNPLQIFGRLK